MNRPTGAVRAGSEGKGSRRLVVVAKVAEAECTRRGWPCYKPQVRQRLATYRVTFFTGPETLGFRTIAIDGVSGAVRLARILPR